MSILGTLGTVFKVIPVVVSGIESLMGRESGKDKLDSALEIIMPFLTQSKPYTAEDLLEGVVLIINGIVKIKHAFGEFTHTKDPEG